MTKPTLVRCVEGHVYDSTQHDACPSCRARGLDVKDAETKQTALTLRGDEQRKTIPPIPGWALGAGGVLAVAALAIGLGWLRPAPDESPKAGPRVDEEVKKPGGQSDEKPSGGGASGAGTKPDAGGGAGKSAGGAGQAGGASTDSGGGAGNGRGAAPEPDAKGGGSSQQGAGKLAPSLADLRKAMQANDFEAAYPLSEKLAAAGDAEAQYHLGMMALKLRGRQDFAVAFKWMRKSAEQGLAEAQAVLGNMYQNGDTGEGEDIAEAVGWYMKAAEQNNARGQYWLGRCYEAGAAMLKKDYQRAGDSYRKAALQGYPGAAEALERLRRSRRYR